ncbi:hypothetical protein ABZ656_04295 [Streptomyces sp. NPDC007095]|uniref:hypothetical protein n=1 Tax=Streptomyces sp. NPDC007095 TaxID=3154482 RepID=UPI003411F24A
MPRYVYTAPVTTTSGETRYETGTVEQPSPLFVPARARTEVSNHVTKTALKPGETVQTDNIQLRSY